MIDPLKVSNQVLCSAIKSGSWFKEVPDDAISWLASHAKVNHYNSGEAICLSGDRREYIYGVLDGVVNLSLAGDGEQCFSIMTFHKGFWFGESALIGTQSKLVEVKAVEVSNVITIPAQELLLLADQYPFIYKNLYLDKLRQSQLFYDMFASVLTYPLTARISLRLLSIIDERGIETPAGKYLSPGLSIAELAHLAMGSEQRVELIVNEWIENRYIIIDDGMWFIPDVSFFEAEAVK